MLELIPVHNLYWKKYLTFGYHDLISLWMDDHGLPVYREVVSLIHQAMIFQKDGVAILRLGNDKICYVDKSEYKSVLTECMKFFLEKEEYLDCAKVRDLLDGKLIKIKSKKKKLKTLI
tara:strand:+ start:1190 stop:1543 length:354 start_codon:yes stop_codon:yes gene_type:complete